MKTPAFQFYPKDWLSDMSVLGMSAEERGAYIMLLCIDWNEGGLPDDVDLLSEVCKVDVSTVSTLVQRLFNERSTDRSTGVQRSTNSRLQREREAQAERRKQQQKAGKASAEKRKNKGEKQQNQRSFNTRSTPVQQACNSSSSSSSSSSITPQPPKGGKGARKKMTSAEVLAELDFGELSNYTEYIDEFGKWIAHRMGYRRPQCGWVEFFTEQLRKLELMSPSTAFLTVQRSRVNGYQGLIEPGPRTPPTGTNGTNGATGGSKAVYALKAKQDAVKEELKAIDDRTSHVATGPLYTADDKARRRELGEMLGKLNRELASV